VAAQATAVSWVLALGLALLARQVFGDGVAYAPLVALACAVTVPLVSRRARRSDGGSAVRPASWVLLAWVPYLFGGAAFELSEPIVQGHWRCGNPVMAMFVVVLASVPVVFAMAVLSAVVVDRFRLVLTTKLAAWAAVGLSVVALCACLRRIDEVDPEHYVASLPVVAALESDVDRYDGPGFSVEYRPRQEGADVAAGGCNVFTHGLRLDPRDRMGPAFERQVGPSCSGTRVRRDASHDLWIVESPAFAGFSRLAFEVHGGGAEAVDIDARRVASSLRPPMAWTASLAVGCAFALALLGVAIRMRRRAEAWRAARPGVHGGGGWVTFEDGTPPAHFAGAATLPACTVLVLESSPRTPHYREHGRLDEGARFATGTFFDDVLQPAEARARDMQAFAILVALLTLAPILAAYLDGLLG
jgi:hypothetical protein